MSNVSDFIIKNGVLIKYVGPGDDVVIPEGVTQIGREAFQFCWGLTGVVFPKTLKVIDPYAFYKCRMTIHASAGSYAETYAKENNIPFVVE